MYLVTRRMLIGVLLFAGTAAQAQIARVAEVWGTVLAERGGSVPRILGPGDVLAIQDVISVARDSRAILAFEDGSRASLRPHTVLRLAAYLNGQPQGMLAGMRKGGMRMQGASAVAFDARLCEEDCAADDRLRPAPPGLGDPVARVVEMKGRVAAGRNGKLALLGPGAALYEHDGIVTGLRSHAVLAFSDGSRISLSTSSRLTISAYRFDERQRAGFAEIHHLGGGARVQSGAIAKQGPEFYRFLTPLGVLRPHGTGWDSLVGAAKQTVDQGADTARSTGEAVVGAVQDTAGQAAQAALNTATAPIMREMSKLMTDLRSNPPTTEAGWNELTSKMTQMSGQLHRALDEAIRLGGAAVDTREFKTAVGLALAAELEFFAVGAAATGEVGSEAVGSTTYSVLQAQVAVAKASSYRLDCLALVGLSHADLDRVSINRFGAREIIAAEVGGYLASEGNAAAQDFFAQAQAAAQALQQRAQQAEAAAAQAAAEAEQRAIEDAQRAADEARDAQREAERMAAEAEAFRQQTASRLEETKPPLEQAAQTGAEIATNTALIASMPFTGEVGAGAAAKETERLAGAGGALAEEGGKAASDAADNAAQAGREVLGQISDAGQAGADAAGAQSGKLLRTIEGIRAAEREFARQVADLKNALDGMTNLSETEKQRVRDTLSEWSRLVAEEVASKIAEATQNPNAQVAFTSLQIMGVIVATAAAVLLVGAPAAALAVLTAVAHTAMTNPSVFDDIPASTIVQATRGSDQAAAAMRSILAAMVEHGKLGADEARRLVSAMGQGTLDTANAANAQLQELFQALEDFKAADRQSDADAARNARGDANQPGQGNSGRTEPAAAALVIVWDGSVEIAGRIVRQGESLRATPGGLLVYGASSGAVVNAPRPDLVEVTPNLFGGDGEVPPGLYVWVRDGAVSLERDGRQVAVAAGNAAIAADDHLALLGYVPNFMRFDDTPATAEGGRRLPDFFRTADGSAVGVCTVR